MEQVFIQLIAIIPSLLLFLFGIVVLALFYRTIRDDLLPTLFRFQGMGVERAFLKESLEAAVESATRMPQWHIEISTADQDHVLERVQRHLKILRNAHILWVDDEPEHNRHELRLFRQLAMDIDLATTSDKALDLLRNHSYDLVISDMARHGHPTAGLDFLQDVREIHATIPVIFYIGMRDPDKGVPAQAFGLTNRPDELLHLILDALERRKT